MSRPLWTLIGVGLAEGACANAGSAMAIAASTHVLVLNPAIALLEAWLLTRWAGLTSGRAVGLALLANYLSLGVGLALNEPLARALGRSAHILAGSDALFWKTLPLTLAAMTLIMFVLTVLLESGVLFRSLQRNWRSTLGTLTRVNLVSYTALAAFYLSLSDFGYLRIPHAPDTNFAQLPRATVYFLDARHRPCAMSLQNGAVQRLRETPIPLREGTSRWYPVFALEPTNAPTRWNLTAPEQLLRTVQTPYPPRPLGRTNKNAVQSPDWRKEPSPYTVRPIPLGGIEILKNDTRHLSQRLQLPFSFESSQMLGAFIVASPNALPGDYLVYEFAGRVMLTHMPTGRTAKLTDGYAPLVVLEP
ncbi:MAG: hypothetical protein NZ556_07635 [Fimbriimonadales bacterium]|nr:hypothetical protein [Fimbriimonadales bacterium]